MKYHHSMNRWKIGCADRHTPGVRKAAILVLSPCRLIDLFRFLYVLEISTSYVKSAVDSASANEEVTQTRYNTSFGLVAV